MGIQIIAPGITSVGGAGIGVVSILPDPVCAEYTGMSYYASTDYYVPVCSHYTDIAKYVWPHYFE